MEDQCKSTSGYAFLLNDSAILWSSKKQSRVALSTIEAEYVACSTATQDAVWLRSFLQHLEIVKSALEPVKIFCDNTAALAVAKDPKYHGKTKHIKKRYHYIRDEQCLSNRSIKSFFMLLNIKMRATRSLRL